MEKNNKTFKPEYHLSSIQQHEDAVLKTSMQFFAEELLPYLKIKGKAVSFAPTELVHLELFSGNIKNPMTEFSEGINTYRVHPIILQSKNADELLKRLEEKQNCGKLITKEDLIPLVLCPLMNGKTSQKERINRAYHITRKATEIKKEDTDKIEAMLYAMADKFLDAVDLEKLKEEIAMTRLGQMIWEDGIEEGKTEGRISAYLEMIRDGFITEKEAAHRLDITQEELNILLEKIQLKQ